MNRLRFLLPLVLAAVFLSACSDQAGKGHATPGLAGAPVGGDFVLQSAAGPFDTKAMRGKVLLLYFGYTNCPDVCPVSVGNGAQALNRLTAEERGRVKLVMVSVDPERDTPAKLKDYAAFFHPEMIGVTGGADEIAAVAKLFGAGYVRQPPRADGGYAVDHSAQTYVVGPDGRLAATLEYGAAVDKVVAAVRKAL